MSRLAAVLIILAVVAIATSAQEPSTPDAENKCGGCPCNNPCSAPPPPPPPSPPPPAPKPPTPTPSGPNCPPPPPKTPSGPSGPSYPTPPSQYIYFTGPPGSLYPIDQSFGGAARGFTVGLPLLISSILLALIIS